MTRADRDAESWDHTPEIISDREAQRADDRWSEEGDTLPRYRSSGPSKPPRIEDIVGGKEAIEALERLGFITALGGRE